MFSRYYTKANMHFGRIKTSILNSITVHFTFFTDSCFDPDTSKRHRVSMPRYYWSFVLSLFIYVYWTWKIITILTYDFEKKSLLNSASQIGLCLGKFAWERLWITVICNEYEYMLLNDCFGPCVTYSFHNNIFLLKKCNCTIFPIDNLYIHGFR